jgi:hypothetical protein
MESAEDVADFLDMLFNLLCVLSSGNPQPLTWLQEKRLVGWKALLNGSMVGMSRAQRDARIREFNTAKSRLDFIFPPGKMDKS